MTLNAEQKAKLASITNAQQREMLLDAIRQEMEIPEYAWEPFPADLDMNKIFAQMAEVTEEVADEAGMDASEVESAFVEDFQLEQIALQAQRTATAESAFLCEPISLDEPIESPTGRIELLRWGIFNPNGPTACELSLESVDSLDSALLTLHAFHPFSPPAFVYGVFPAAVVSNHADLLKCVGALFTKNGNADAPLILGAPTHVIVPGDSPLKAGDARALFESALGAATRFMADKDRSCDNRFFLYATHLWRRIGCPRVSSQPEGWPTVAAVWREVARQWRADANCPDPHPSSQGSDAGAMGGCSLVSHDHAQRRGLHGRLHGLCCHALATARHG